MNRRILLLAMLSGFAAFPSSTFAEPPTAKALLLEVAKGQTFTDIGSDDKTTPVLVDVPEVGGKALKVAFAAGDTVGVKSVKIKNWKPYAALRMEVFSPGKQDVTLVLNLFHARTKDYNTRTVVPLKLKPGKNDVNLGTDELVNVNGSAAYLAEVSRFFLADEEKKGPTLYFGDIWLEGGTAPVATNTGGSAPVYSIKGKIGGSEVDLVATPLGAATAAGGGAAGAAAPVVAVHGDPARVARIRAAKMPAIEKPTLFNTPEADAVCSAMEIFPPNNPWNLVVEDWPVHPNSKNLIGSVGANKPLRYNADMNFVLVPPNQPKIEVKLGPYSGESDKGPYPVPENTPIEGYPVGYAGQTLDAVQRKDEGDSDRHAIVVDPAKGVLYEFYQMRKTDNGWQAAGAAIFDLKSNKMRPEEWTSTDAAGLPIFPSIVRYDELKRGAVEHALRVTIVKSRRAYVYPARHFASPHTSEDLPRMGERIRLKKDVDVSSFSPDVQTILKALKKYGMFVADNGLDWSLSVAPDPRIGNLAEELRKLKGGDFEVITAPAGYTEPE